MFKANRILPRQALGSDAILERPNPRLQRTPPALTRKALEI